MGGRTMGRIEEPFSKISIPIALCLLFVSSGMGRGLDGRREKKLGHWDP